MVSASDLIAIKREHLKRLANQSGAAGEQHVLSENSALFPRPTGRELAALLTTLEQSGIRIKGSSFDAVSLPTGAVANYFDPEIVAKAIFIEIKTANQTRVQADFTGFFFAFTEGEIQAAEALGSRHRVMLLNRATGQTLLTSVPELLARAKSTTWQVSIQL